MVFGNKGDESGTGGKDNGQQGGTLQERQPPCPEVVQQGTETLGSNGNPVRLNGTFGKLNFPEASVMVDRSKALTGL
jgi:hypothetical protein